MDLSTQWYWWIKVINHFIEEWNGSCHPYSSTSISPYPPPLPHLVEIITLSSPKNPGSSGATLLSVWEGESGILQQIDTLLSYPARQLLLLDQDPKSLLIVGKSRVEKWSIETKTIQWSWPAPSEKDANMVIRVKKVGILERSNQVYVTGPSEHSVNHWFVQSLDLTTGSPGSSYEVEGVSEDAILVLSSSEATLMWVDERFRIMRHTFGGRIRPMALPLSSSYDMLIEERVENLTLVEFPGSRGSVVAARASIGVDTHVHIFRVHKEDLSFYSNLPLEPRYPAPPMVCQRSLTDGTIYLLRARTWEADNMKFEIMDVKAKQIGEGLVPWDHSTYGSGAIIGAWFESVMGKGESLGYPIVRSLVVTEDRQVVLLEKNVEIWRRDEAVSDVVDATIVDLPERKLWEPTADPALLAKGGSGHGQGFYLLDLWNQYSTRWGKHTLTLAKAYKSFLDGGLTDTPDDQILQEEEGKDASSTDSPSDSSLFPYPRKSKASDSSSSSKGIASSLYRDQFGVRKMVVIMSGTGRVLGLDSGEKGRKVWERWFGPGKALGIFSLKPGTVEYPPLLGVVISLPADLATEPDVEKREERTVVYTLNAMTGEHFMEPVTFPFPSSKVIQFPITAPAVYDLSLLGLYDTEGKIHLFPGWDLGPDQLDALLSDLYFTSPITLGDRGVSGRMVEAIEMEESGQVKGTKSFSQGDGPSGGIRLDMVPTWSLSLAPGERVVGYATHPEDDIVASLGRVLEDRSVLYKYLNPHLLSILTHDVDGGDEEKEKGKGGVGTLGVYLVDSVTGSLLHHVTHPGVRVGADGSGVSITQRENWVAYTFFSSSSSGNPVKGGILTVLDLYEAGDKAPPGNHTSSFTRPSPPVIHSRAYPIFGGSGDEVQAMGVSGTRNGITTKEFLLALSSHKIFGLSKGFLDAMSMTVDSSSSSASRNLGEDGRMIVSYDLEVMGTRGILTAPSLLESTSLVLTYGEVDVWWTQVTPSGTFDLLSADFSKEMLIMTIMTLSAAILFTRPMVKRKMLSQSWA